MIGGGAEMKISENLSARLEGLHYHFSDAKTNGLSYDGHPNPNLSQNISVIRAGLSWHY